MREIRTEIHINAPASKVWSAITDFKSWGSWNPIVAEVSGAAGTGEKLRVAMREKGGTYEPVILDFNSPKYLRWRGTMMAGFIMTNEKIFELTEANGKTHLVHKETFAGLMVPLFWNKMEKWVPSMLDSMNKALKTRVEAAI